MKVACIGEAMIELSMAAGTENMASVGVAGDTLNTAVYLKRCAPNLKVDYVTKLGADAFSDRIESFIAEQGIGTNSIARAPEKFPGLYAISLDEAGERSFSYWRSASAARDMFRSSDGADFSQLLDYEVLYFSAISLAILPRDVRAALVEWLPVYKRETGGRISFDSNYRPPLWDSVSEARADVAAVWKLTDIALPSVDDEMALFGDQDQQAVLHRLASYGVYDGALKCGPDGPVSLAADPCDQNYPAAAKVVDSTAAGDSFNGGYLAARLTGASQGDALMAGHNCAREVVQHKGAIIPASNDQK